MATARKSPESNIFNNWVSSLTQKRIRAVRLIVQIVMFILVFGILIGLSRIPFPVPFVVPAGSPFATVWGGFDAIQYILSRGQFPFLVFGLFFITGALVGKLFCGWACPVGFWQDFIAFLPISKIKPSKPTNRDLQELSGAIMWIAIIFTAWVGWQRAQGNTIQDNFFTSIPYGFVDPAATMFITLYYAFSWDIFPGDDLFNSIDSLGNMFLLKMVVLFSITIMSMKVPRGYCRWICPTGALLGYTSKNSILTIKRDPLKCEDGCNSCETACPMGVPITDEDPEGISNTLCINCGNCVDACPDAMSFGIRL